jgi:CRP-like cAMP-binding protein
VRTLLELAGSSAASASSEGVVLHITHQQLAQKIGVARETVSLALSQLRRRNLLRTGRNQLTFNPSLLGNWEAVEAAQDGSRA